MIVIFFVLGCSASGTCNLAFVYYMEFLPLSKHAIGATTFAVADGLVLPLCTLYFMFVSKNWAYISMVGSAFILFALCTIWFVPESPKILVNQKKFDEAEKILRAIAASNGVDYPEDMNLEEYFNVSVE